MKSRDLTIDIARGLIVLLIPATHTTLYYSKLSVQQSFWGDFLRCFAEGAGAQSLMFLLGFSFFLGRSRPRKFIIHRAISLFVLAYVLNFLRFVLPALLGFIPASFFNFSHIQNNIWGIIDLLMAGGIFQFAAISYLICSGLYYLKVNWGIIIVLAVLIAIVSPVLWAVRVDNFLLDYLLKFLNGMPPAVFFPFFPWGAYPLFGLAFGCLYTKTTKPEFYRLCLVGSAILVLVGVLALQFEPASYNRQFYRLGPGGTLMHVGLVLLWLRLCHLLAVNLEFRKKLAERISWCSINITIIYICQECIIGWLFPFFGFMDLSLQATVWVSFGVSLLTFLIVVTAKYLKKNSRYVHTGDPSSIYTK